MEELAMDMTEGKDSALPPASAAQPAAGEVPSSSPAAPSDLSLGQSNTPKVKVCGVCNEKESRYKCTRCLLPYCSVACSTIHKANHPTAPQSAPTTTANPNPAPAPAPAPRSNGHPMKSGPGTASAAGVRGPFAALDDSKELRTLFRIYPRLQSQLEEIDTATLPPGRGGEEEDEEEGEEEAAAAKGRRGQAGRHSHGGTGRGRKEAWNRDRALESGLRALRCAREARGKDGEGVREFSKLVLRIVAGDEGAGARELIQKELAEENARIISQLLSGEM